MPDFTPINFADLSASLLDRAHIVVPQWLPGGLRRGDEWVCGDLAGGEGSSCSVNLKTGSWADFAGDDKGGDLISLYAAIYNVNQGQAARQIMKDMGWEQGQPARMPAAQVQQKERPLSSSDARVPRKSMWRAIVPVPDAAPLPDFRHWHYTEVVQSWEYRFGGQLYGHIVRFRTSDGGKEILPHTWCVDEGDGRGTMRWHWKQWDEPRPLYVPANDLSDGSARDVVLVEGEKCALAGHKLLGTEFDFVSWPGGSKAWAKANWTWLSGRTVRMWPDCDSQRMRLNADERKAGVDPETKPLMGETRQPGMAAMIGIGSILAANHGCTVLMCPVPKPGMVAHGWDIADAIEQGWDAEQVRAFIRGAKAFTPPDDAARAKASPVDSPAGASAEDVKTAWRAKLLLSSQGSIKAVRENVVLALDGLPDEGLPGANEASGVIAYNEFTNDVVKLKASPWGTPAGVWEEVDDLLMGEWLTREHWLPSMPRGTLEEAVRMVAYRHRYHPVRSDLEVLRKVWDGEKRLATWIERCCISQEEVVALGDDDPLRKYLARVGTWMIMAMCARVLTPGCKFDYMVIFEGPQGVGKSTLARVLGGEFFADTGLVLGDKDSFQNLQGIWVYEWGELDSLNKSEVTKVKQFISSQKDRFRASFDRRAKDYPRQVIFVGTTNEDHYLTDPTGNRRMWPVRVSRQVDIQWLRQHRDQLFAEALSYLDAGDRFHPTTREQRELFEPQQQQRAVENAIESVIGRYLYDENQRVGASGENGTLVDEIGLVELLQRVGIGLEKLGPGRFHEKQAAAALRRLGWIEGRSSKPGRPRVYRRPKIASPTPPSGGSGLTTRQDAGAQTVGATDDCPF